MGQYKVLILGYNLDIDRRVILKCVLFIYLFIYLFSFYITHEGTVVITYATWFHVEELNILPTKIMSVSGNSQYWPCHGSGR